jgi:hypothetical protein
VDRFAGAAMTETSRCPYCGSAGGNALDSLYREVARIRELAEHRTAGDPASRGSARTPDGDESARSAARIAELTREVHELRATVARLRGSAVPGLAALAPPA